ncbi:TPA: helix-turn-helix transcriptional regulator [Elizabethkingia anophelis]|uniref:helix-turn-helix domain-containing protein n=1 Tax=Elizabethkingia anophelis TaxID=1117645 RepID=UPI001A237BCA|nr:helix-turn-helix transcriptional regulator [Elizabethkingia anophelis]MCT4132559.1 helix-turn-helix transcriptional regulator [Elizabethkingia anophelis]MCT4146789.1 helix-turn-helix transcriptional regulator [Elizabethkingia anophelis]HAT3998734.1 helix-turn-helix transcriptional regulator [Elizabethkingia anophelis]HAT4009738.1 helix-turn-helix transcriptional regulator [Elizabethkingia anophelis]
MRTQLHHRDLPDLSIKKEFNTTGTTLSENISYLNHSFIHGSYREISFDGIHIGYGDLQLRQPALIRFEAEAESVELHFALQGNSTASIKGESEDISFSPYHHNIMYANQMKGHFLWDKGNIQIFEINFLPSFFKKYLPDDSTLFERFRTMMDKGNMQLMLPQHFMITPEMHHTIREILNCKRTGIYKKMFLEARTIELLLLQLEQINAPNDQISLSKSDCEKMYAIRDFIEQHIAETHSLIDLAHRFGTNEYALKKGFKEVFNTTVFNYWSSLKMQNAKKLILEESLHINEIALTVGYKNPRHFSTAFKKHFGHTPTELKNFIKR